MSDRPKAEEVLDALATFVQGEVRPALRDRALRFRTLIAADLLRKARAEIMSNDARRAHSVSLADELGLLDAESVFEDLEATFCAQIPRASDEKLATIRQYLLQTHRVYLDSVCPRFSTDMDIEKKPT